MAHADKTLADHSRRHPAAARDVASGCLPTSRDQSPNAIAQQALNASIRNSPRMVAQRQQLNALADTKGSETRLGAEREGLLLQPSRDVVQRTAIKGVFSVYAKQKGLDESDANYGVLRDAFKAYARDKKTLEQFEADNAHLLPAAGPAVTLPAALTDDQLIGMLKLVPEFRLHCLDAGDDPSAVSGVPRIQLDMTGRDPGFPSPKVFESYAAAAAALKAWILSRADLGVPGHRQARHEVPLPAIACWQIDRDMRWTRTTITGLNVNDWTIRANGELSIGHLYPI